MTKRRPGRPLGSVDLHGRAKRVDQRVVPAYLDRVAQKIRRLRLEQGISVEELAAAAGVGRFGIWKIEARTRGSAPTLRSIVRIALALRIEPSELLP